MSRPWKILLGIIALVFLVPTLFFLYMFGFLGPYPASDEIVSNILPAKDNRFDVKILREEECFNIIDDGTTRLAIWHIILKKKDGDEVKKRLETYRYFHASSDIKSKREIRYTLAWEEEDRVIGYEDTTGRSGKILIFDDYLYFGNDFIYTDDLEKAPVSEQIQAILSRTIVRENDLSEYSCVFVGSDTRLLDKKTVVNNNPHVILVVDENVFKGILSSGPIVMDSMESSQLCVTPEWIQINDGFNVYSFFDFVYLSCEQLYLNDEMYETFGFVEKDSSRNNIHYNELRKIE